MPGDNSEAEGAVAKEGASIPEPSSPASAPNEKDETTPTVESHVQEDDGKERVGAPSKRTRRQRGAASSAIEVGKLEAQNKMESTTGEGKDVSRGKRPQRQRDGSGISKAEKELDKIEMGNSEKRSQAKQEQVEKTAGGGTTVEKRNQEQGDDNSSKRSVEETTDGVNEGKSKVGKQVDNSEENKEKDLEGNHDDTTGGEPSAGKRTRRPRADSGKSTDEVVHEETYGMDLDEPSSVESARRRSGDVGKSKENESDDGMNDGEGDVEEPSPTGKRSRRSKKSVDAYKPSDFVNEEKEKKYTVNVIRGRGIKLGDIPAIRAKVNSYSSNSEELGLAHRLIYKYRGRMSHKEFKRNILAFNGYLRELGKDEQEEDLEDEDEEAETYYSVKAYKLNTRQLSMLLDLFSIDRKPKNGVPANKDFMIDRLLDFLGAPSLDLLTEDALPQDSESSSPSPAESRKGGSPLPLKKRKRVDDADNVDEIVDTTSVVEKKSKGTVLTHEDWAKRASIQGVFFMVREHTKGAHPSDATLRQWVQAYVACFDLDTASMKHVIQTASAKFGVDMRERINLIREYLASEI
eukprot:scaffold22642_cov134-Cylindrotheca_fusiformis.AAC.24